MLQAWTMDQIGLFLVLILIYSIFLLYQLFKRREKMQYLAYAAAIIPYAYMWTIGADYLEATFYLLILWTLPLARDLIVHYVKSGKETDYANSIVLYAVSLGLFFLFAAIMPAIVPEIKARPGVQSFGDIIWLPILDVANPFINPFRLLLSIDIFLMIVPMIYEVKVSKERIAVLPNIFLAIIFALPTIYAMYTWVLVTDLLFIIGLFIGVLYFILLLVLTRGKK